jgi:hypothetical protein
MTAGAQEHLALPSGSFSPGTRAYLVARELYFCQAMFGMSE